VKTPGSQMGSRAAAIRKPGSDWSRFSKLKKVKRSYLQLRELHTAPATLKDASIGVDGLRINMHDGAVVLSLTLTLAVGCVANIPGDWNFDRCDGKLWHFLHNCAVHMPTLRNSRMDALILCTHDPLFVCNTAFCDGMATTITHCTVWLGKEQLHNARTNVHML